MKNIPIRGCEGKVGRHEMTDPLWEEDGWIDKTTCRHSHVDQRRACAPPGSFDSLLKENWDDRSAERLVLEFPR